MALDVCWKSDDWQAVGGDKEFMPTKGRVLLTTGGPACQVICDLDNWADHGTNPEIQWQDWGTPWTTPSIKCELEIDFDTANDALEWFVNLFYWGEQPHRLSPLALRGQMRDSPSQIPPFNLFIVARTTIASLTQDNETLVAQLEELRPVKEQLDSLWIVLAVVFTLGVLF